MNPVFFLRRFFYLPALACLLLCCNTKPAAPVVPQLQKPAKDSISVMVYENKGGGFGYRVSLQGKDIIDQPHLPAVQHNTPFASREDALQTAALVKNKIILGILPPVISVAELDSMHIRYRK